ncbi:short transient receptor potential channel 4-associated protein-like isoform X2 [Convolutriloba macropyga]|uniref:short transient receptor potential channel 4-associated protein-like isoform X2 n=1 Tax=Convolutriloba macropyga TaxID=536237 RepID=UPI003F523C0B
MSPTEPSKLVSVHQKIFLRRFNGGGPSSLSCLGSSFIPQTRAPIETGSEVLECLTSLNTSFWGEYDNTLCLDKMHKIYELIVDDRIGRDTTDSSYSTSKASPNVENLVSLGGIQIFHNFILEYPLKFETAQKSEVQKRKDQDAYDKVRFLAIQALQTLSTSSPLRNKILSQLANNVDLIRKLLDSLSSRLLGYVSMLLLEDLMVHRDHPLDLRSLDIDRLLISLSIDQMSNLFRVLSYTVVDMGSEPEELLCAIDSSKRKSRRNSVACERNITYLASIPRLLVSVVEIIVRKFEPNNKLFMEYLGVAIDILEETSSPANALIAQLRMTHMGNHDNTGQFPPLNTNPEQLVSAMNRIEINKDLTMRIEGCILVTGLLYGSMRMQTIEKLNQYRLIPRINELFSFFFAVDPDTGTLTTDQYGFLEGESLIQSLRIQILRVIHSMCDQTLNNICMLTSTEFEKLQRSRDPYQVLAPVEFSEKAGQMCRGVSGLLTKMNDLAKKELAPVYRFWLHRAIESFLRGKALFPYQVFMSDAGLIEHTVEGILDLSYSGLPHRNGEATSAEGSSDTATSVTTQVGHSYEDMIQCSFDLLAQMVKFNVSSLQILSDRLFTNRAQPQPCFAMEQPFDTPSTSGPGAISIYSIIVDNGTSIESFRSQGSSSSDPLSPALSFSDFESGSADTANQCVAESKLQKFINIVFNNIIDSNMFVRCIILSINKFENLGINSSAMQKMKDNVLLKRFANFNTRIKYICKILRCINVDTLTQDNVSCLNTALVILLFAKDRNQLSVYLEAINKIDHLSELTFYFENLHHLCNFWKQHYLPQSQDVKCLVEGSGIEFSRWLDCVNTMTKIDSNCNTSLAFYCSNLAKTNAEKIDVDAD